MLKRTCAAPAFGLLAAMLMTTCGALADEPVQTEPVQTEGGLVYPEGAAIPRSLTPVEADWQLAHPQPPTRGATPPPTGPVFCPPEYARMEGIIIAWEGTSSWLSILAQMGGYITTQGDADLFVFCDTTSETTSARNAIVAQGGNNARIKTLVRTTDTIWCRDYGPRYIFEGDCRAIVDHTYNRPRPNDNAMPAFFASYKNHARYEIPLTHGGGNFHLDALGNGYATRLINNENPSYSEPQILGFWQDYQNLAVELFTPFPTSVDSTQHIDMWMQVIADDKVMISDWPAQSGSTQDIICDNAAADFQSRGYTVYRLPARTSGGTHYTYTNVVMCNDIVLLPLYTNSTISPYNAQALATWQSALPGKTIIQINCEAIVSAAGVMHCIVMHVPEARGNGNPTAYLKNLNGGESLNPGDNVTINWISDDNGGVVNVDLLLSTDGGATFPTVIASGTADDGSYTWNVPDVFTTQARVRVVARDGLGNTGFDDSDGDFTINGTVVDCPADFDGSGAVELGDLGVLLGCWGTPCGDITGDNTTDLSDLGVLLGAWGACP